jgi:hypothetical protein
MELLKPLMKMGGIVAMLPGTFWTTGGAYALAGGTNITFGIGERVLSAQEGGPIFSIIGIILLLGGIAMIHIGFKLSRPIILTLVLGECSLIIPVIFLGMGYNLVAGIALLVLSYSFIALLFLWLTKW